MEQTQMYLAHIANDKREQNVRDHLENTAEISGKFLSNIQLGKSAYLAGLLHDCGKFTKDFDNYLRKSAAGLPVARGAVIHSFSALSFLMTRYGGDDLWDELTAEILSCADAGHHGLIDCIDESGRSAITHRIHAQPEYDKRASTEFIKECGPLDRINSLFSLSKDEITQCFQRCQLFAKNEEICFYLGLLVRLLSSSVIDADCRDTADFMTGIPRHEISADCELWNQCAINIDLYLNLLKQKAFDKGIPSSIVNARELLSDKCQEAAELPEGIYQLNLPTGTGKTLSSLRYAIYHALKYQKKRIIYVAPLLTIIDQNAKEIRTALMSDAIVTEHHSNVLNDENDYDVLSRYNYLTQTWDSPIVITTLVQFLNTLFSEKKNCVRRFHSLSESVIILDEVQTVPNKMLTLFNLTINFLSEICHATIILCSATQPLFDSTKINHRMSLKKGALLEHSNINEILPLFERTEIIDKGRYQLNEILPLVEDMLCKHDSLLVVCNKKSEALFIYNAMKNKGIRCFHLSASMCAKHRLDTIEKIEETLTKKEKVLCVSTQVIEAGVDISFASVLRFTAGLDSIVQSAGRCNRHGELSGKAPVYMVTCADEDLRHLHEIDESKDAAVSLLTSYQKAPDLYNRDLSSDKSIAFYYKTLYNGMKEGYRDFVVKGKPSLYSLLSANEEWLSKSDDTNYLLNQAFRSAGEIFTVFDTDQQGVIVPYSEGADIILEFEKAGTDGPSPSLMRSLLERAKPYTVNLFSYQLQKYQSYGALKTLCGGCIQTLDNKYYDAEIGVCTDVKEGPNECDILIL